jgi:hypothetical protein
MPGPVGLVKTARPKWFKYEHRADLTRYHFRDGRPARRSGLVRRRQDAVHPRRHPSDHRATHPKAVPRRQVHFLFTTLATGGTYVVDGPGDAARFWDVIRARSVTVATLFPNPFDIVEHPDAGRSLDTIRLAFSQQTSEALVQSLPGVTCATSYGATELGGMALVAFGDDCVRPGPVLGRPLLGMVERCWTTTTSRFRTVSCASGGWRRRLDIGICRMHLPRCCATAGRTPATSVEKIGTG